MVITFVSNYINHHQLPFCRAMSTIKDVEFHFIQTMRMEQKRIEMGWAVDVTEYPFVSLFYEDKETCANLILDSDVTIFGWTEGSIEDLETKRLSSGKLSFRVSERIYREGQWKFISPNGLIHKYKEHIRYRNKPVYLLCAGAYVASDFALIHAYPGKMLKWGYFPEGGSAKASEYVGQIGNDNEVDGAPVRILWAGRLIDLKHPEYAVEVARALNEKGYDFELDIVGDGRKKDELSALIDKYGLSGSVHLSGGKKPGEVLEYMKRADVFLFTSNYLEGWGAVVNEAMSCGCCVVASAEAGAVPFLIEDGINGCTYQDGSLKELISKVLLLFENETEIKSLASEGRRTIEEVWNAENAAEQLVRFCKEFNNGDEPIPCIDGPISIAGVIDAPGIMRTLSEKNVLE